MKQPSFLNLEFNEFVFSEILGVCSVKHSYFVDYLRRVVSLPDQLVSALAAF